jgi:tRNA pseudouridine65 synthase
VARALSVLFRDETLLVVDKPSGMLTHRGWGSASVVLVDLVRELTGSNTAYPAHRLDRGASGAVLFALDADTAREIGAAISAHEVSRSYVALVRGRPPDHGVIDHPIPRQENGPRVPAVSEFFRLASVEAQPRTVSLVEVRPRSGRLHQVRRHLKHISHPIIGDANYGKGALNRAMAARYQLERLALHAHRLSLEHPRTGEAITACAPLPEDLAGPLARIGFEPLPGAAGWPT